MLAYRQQSKANGYVLPRSIVSTVQAMSATENKKILIDFRRSLQHYQNYKWKLAAFRKYE
jgi:hypothetical protein